jgi:hypothetical protein
MVGIAKRIRRSDTTSVRDKAETAVARPTDATVAYEGAGLALDGGAKECVVCEEG